MLKSLLAGLIILLSTSSAMSAASAPNSTKDSFDVNFDLPGFKNETVAKLMDAIESASQHVYEAGDRQGVACTVMHSDLNSIFQQDADLALTLVTNCIVPPGKVIDHTKLAKDLSSLIGRDVTITNPVTGGATVSN